MAGTSSTRYDGVPGQTMEYELYIQDQLARTRRQVKLVEIALAALQLCVLVLGYILLVVLIDHWLFATGLGVWGRLAAFLGLVLGGIGFFCWRVLPLLLARVNPIFAAHSIEQIQPGSKNSLINFLLLRRERDQLAAPIYDAIERKAANDLSQTPIETAVDRSAVIKAGYALLALVVVLCMYKLLSPKDPLRTVGRMAAPWANIPPATRVTISDIHPGTTKVFQGEVVTISALVMGLRRDEPVTIYYSTTDGQSVDQPVAMRLPEKHYRHEGLVPADAAGLQQGIEYYIKAGDATSDRFRIDTVTAPAILVEKVEYHYPTYVGLPPRIVERQGDVKALDGTKIVLHARANVPISTAYLDFNSDGGRDLPLALAGQSAGGNFVLGLNDKGEPTHTSYQIRFLDRDGHENPQPVRHTIEVLADQPPAIEVLEPTSDPTELALNGSLPISIRAGDRDFKLRRVEVFFERRGEALKTEVLLDAPQADTFQGGFVFRPQDFPDAKFKAGDEIEFWAEARDNRAPVANRAQTSKYRIVLQDRVSQEEAERQKQIAQQKADETGEQNQNGQAQATPGQPQNPQSGDPTQAREQQASASPEPTPDPEADPAGAMEKLLQHTGDPTESSAPPSARNEPRPNQEAQNEEQAEERQEQGEKGSDEEGENSGQDGAGQQTGGQEGSGGEGQQQKQAEGSGQSQAQQGGEGEQSESSSGQSQQQEGEGAGQSQSGEKSGGQKQSGDQGQRQPGEQQSSGQGNEGGEQGGGQKQQESRQGSSVKPQEESMEGGSTAGEQGGERGEQSAGQKPQNQQGQPGGEASPDAQSEAGEGPGQSSGQKQPGQKSGGQQSSGEQSGEGDQPGSDSQSGEKNSPGAGQTKNGQSKNGQTKNGQAGNQQTADQQPGEKGSGEQQGSQEAGEKPGEQNGQGQGKQQPGKASQGKKPGSAQQGAQANSGEQQNGEQNASQQSNGQQSGKPGGSKQGQSRQPGANPQKGQRGEGDKAGEKGGLEEKQPPSEEESQEDASGGDGESQQGNSGAGQSSQQNKPSAQAQGENQARSKQAQPSQGQQKEQGDEATSPSTSNKESSSEGGESGDRSGGGKQGGGQKSNSPGTGSAGQNTASDEGAGQSAGAGDGETSTGAGDKVEGDQPQHGQGKQSQSSGQGRPGQGQGQRSPQPGGQQAGESAGEEQGQPGESSNASGKPATQGGLQPRGGGQPGSTGGGVDNMDDLADENRAGPGAAVETPADPANLEYKRRATELVLDKLKDQLDRNQVDPELLKKMNWTQDDLRKFVSRWDKMKAEAKEDARGQERMREALERLNLKRRGVAIEQRSAQGDDKALREMRWTNPPAEYEEQFRAYTEGAAKSTTP